MESRFQPQKAPVTAVPAGRRPQICPSWMPREEFEVCRSDPYQAFNAAQTKIAELHQRVTIAKKLNQTLLENPQYKHGQAVQSFEGLKQEHIQLNDAYNDLEAVNETLQEVIETLRGDKHQFLVEINALKRESTIQTIENQQLDQRLRQLHAFNSSIDLKLQSQESQLAQLDDDCKEAGKQSVMLDNEITALDGTCQNYSLQSSSLSDLRQHLDTTRVAQDRAIQALEREVQSKAQEVIQHDAQLWEFKREMSGRILALQKKAQECNDELNRLHRLSEHEINTLAAQNRALNDELKSTADALFATRREKTDFSTAAKKEIYQRKEEIQQCLSVLDLVERQNQGLEASILRLMEQNKLSEKQVAEKDSINHKNLIEQANFISMLHMELQSTREDLYILKARLCRHCRETLLGDDVAEDMALQAQQRARIAGAGANANEVALRPMDFDGNGAVKLPDALTDTERRRMEEEMKRMRDQLETVNRELLKERETREAERREEEEQRRQSEQDARARALEEDAKRRRSKEDERKVAAGEEAQTLTVRFVDGTRRKIDAFPSDTVGDVVQKICSKLGIVQSDLFHLAHRINENSIVGAVDRFLDRNRTLAQEEITPKSNLVFKVKHFKRQQKWSDPVALEWFFRQIHALVVSEYYPISEKLAVELASYELQAVFGDYSGRKRHAYFDRVGLDSYLPVSVSAHEYEYWQERLFRLHKRRKGLTATQARAEYVNRFASESPYWGMTFFDISDRSNQRYIAGISEDGLYIFRSDRRSLVSSQWTFENLVAWDQSNHRNVGLAVKMRGQSMSTIFGTSRLQSEEMSRLLTEYYLLLPDLYRDRLGILLPNEEEIKARLPPAKQFLDPIAKRRKPMEFGSTLESFKANYMEISKQPVRKLCQVIDSALDEGRNLEDFDLANCDPPLTDDGFRELMDALRSAREGRVDDAQHDQFLRNVFLTRIDLSQMRPTLTDASMQGICELLRAYNGITYVNLSGITLDSTITEPLCRLQNLQTLILRQCGLSADTFNSLFGRSGVFQITPTRLEHLDVEGNALKHDSIKLLCDVLEGTTNNVSVLKHLNIAHNKVEDAGLTALIAAIRKRNEQFRNGRGVCLQVLKCGGNAFGLGGANHLASLVTTGIVELSIAATEMNFEAAVGISKQLLGGGNITSLDMSRCEKLGDELKRREAAGTDEFFQFLRGGSSSNVTTLDLSHCRLNFTAASALAKVLDNNQRLVDVKLAGNSLAENGMLPDAWHDLLRHQRFITHLDLSDNKIRYNGLQKIFAAIASNRDCAIKTLRLNGGNHFEDAPHNATHVEMRDFLEHCTSVAELYLCDTKINDSLLNVIGEGLARNRTLRRLVANSNAFNTRGVAQFSKHLGTNTTLEHLDLSSRAIQMSDDTYIQAYKLLIENSNVEQILL